MLTTGSNFGKYEIREVIGKGGMGTVYRAYDSSNGRDVALKLINEKLASSIEYRAKLAKEAEIAASIDSPNVVGVWEQSEIDNIPFIALELISGELLADFAKNLDLEQKLDLVLQIARGIQAAHKAGLIHRDLKPENIGINADGQVKILDFGLAKTIHTDSVDAQGNVEGTLLYLSPEQLSGEPLTPASDLFSFGIILYELFTGHRPFEGEFSASIMYSILHEDPSSPCELNRDLPAWIGFLIQKLLAKSPSDRYPDMDEVIEFMNSSRSADPGASDMTTIRPRQTITVIHLKNLSGDPSWDYFAEGFTDDIRNELAKRTDLVVTAEPATSVPRDIPELFDKCHTDFVMTGSLMRLANIIKLSLSIYGGKGDTLVFSEKYDGQVEELFDILSKAAEDASIMLAEVTGYSAIEVDEILKTNVSAYDYYLKGKSYYQTNKPDDLEFAVDMFKKAISIDQYMALAYAGLSDVYAFQYMAYYEHTPEKIMAAIDAAKRAITINPRLAEGHRALGRCQMFTGSFNQAEKSFLKAIEFNPKYAVGFRTLAWLKEMQGDHNKALEWAGKALRQAPTDLETHLLLSLINMDLRKYTLAMATLRRAIELGPDYGRAYYNLGTIYLKLGLADLALENFNLASKFKGDPNCCISSGYIHMSQGEFDKGRRCFAESIENGYMVFIAHYYNGLLEKLAGHPAEAERAFQLSIEAGAEYEKDDPGNVYVKVYKAMALAGLGEFERAIDMVENISHGDEADGEILYNIARVYALSGDLKKAKEILDLSMQLHAGPTEKEVQLDPHFAALID